MITEAQLTGLIAGQMESAFRWAPGRTLYEYAAGKAKRPHGYWCRAHLRGVLAREAYCNCGRNDAFQFVIEINEL